MIVLPVSSLQTDFKIIASLVVNYYILIALSGVYRVYKKECIGVDPPWVLFLLISCLRKSKILKTIRKLHFNDNMYKLELDTIVADFVFSFNILHVI